MKLRRRAKCGKRGLRGIATAMLAVVACGAPAAGQSLVFEPPLYQGSAEGVPLAGQDGWHVPGVGIESEWRVYHNGGSELGFDPLPGGDGQVVGVAPEAPVAGPERVERSIRVHPAPLRVVLNMAVDFGGELPAGEEIGQISLEPQETSASFACVIRSEAAAPARTWALEMVYYTASAERRQEPIFEGLAPGVWYELHISGSLESNELWRVDLLDTKTWLLRCFDARGLYFAGGAAGGLAMPRALRLSAGAGDSAGAAEVALGFDNLWINEHEPCYGDCNRDGEWGFFDFLCFQTRFAGRDPYADCDGTGTFDVFDFLCFQNTFASRSCGP